MIKANKHHGPVSKTANKQTLSQNIRRAMGRKSEESAPLKLNRSQRRFLERNHK